MKISQLIFFGFLFVLLLFSVTTYINYRQSEVARRNSEYFSQSTNIVRQANRFQRNTLNIVSSLRGFLLTGDKSFIQAYDSAQLENKSILFEFESTQDSVQSRRLHVIQQLAAEWQTEFAIFRTLTVRDSSPDSLNAFHDQYRERFAQVESGRTSMALQDELRAFINEEYERRNEQKRILDDSLRSTKQISFYLTICSIISGLFIAGFLAFRISSRILEMVDMSRSISAGNYNVRMKDDGKDELNMLAQSLNHMARVLDENFTLLRRKNKELDQFAHIVSHDLKAPLRGIDNVVAWIEEDHGAELSPKVHEYIGLIKGRIVRAENLIAGILSYARVGKDVQDKELVNISELVSEVVETIGVREGIRIEVAPGLPVLFTERLPLFQVFSNLVSNAIKYNDRKDSIVRIYHEDQGTHFEFFVADNGPGIAAAYHDKIFTIFQTLQERDSFESTGVGLAIVKKILDARNEQIRVVSQPGDGAIFSFTWSKMNTHGKAN